MPFVKRNSTPAPHDMQRLFIGREGELLFFIQNILKPEEPDHNIISIAGQGGVGKSTLLTRLIAEIHSGVFNEYCATALVDERQFTPADIMGKFAEQLHLMGSFEKTLKQYKEALRKLQAEPETLQDIVLRKVPDLTGATVEGVPLVGPILREGLAATTEHLLAKYQAAQVSKDKERLENPIEDLTRAFVEELNRLTDTQVTLSSTREKRQRRVFLFFDTFEQLASVATPWLLDYFLQANISNNVVLVTAGREGIEHSTPDGLKPWLPYLASQSIYSISLDSFTLDETCTYLARQGVTDADQVATIQQLSGGLPLYLALLTSNPLGKIDPTKDVVINFLRWIPEQEALKRQLALDAALLSLPFTMDDLEVFSYVSEAERANLYQWLIDLPFIRTSPLDGRHSYHDLVQALFSRHLHQLSHKRYYATRTILAAYYTAQLRVLQADRFKSRASSPDQMRSVYRLDEWLEIALATAYQLFVLPDATNHWKAMDLILRAYEYTYQIEELSRFLHKILQDQPHNLLSSDAQYLVELLIHYIEADTPSAPWIELLTASDNLLKTVAGKTSFSSKLCSYIYRKRGFAYKRLGEYQKALQDYDRAIELYPTYARGYSNRGSAYRSLGEYEQAIADYSEALKYRPNYTWAYTGRGQTYSLCKDYARALQDFKRAIEIEPGYQWAYFWRGMTHLWLRERAQAHADLVHCATLSPGDARAGWMQLWCDMDTSRPAADLIERLADVAAQEPQSFWASLCRCLELCLCSYFEAALALLDDTNRLKPEDSYNYAWHIYFWQGMTYVALERYPEASTCIEKALTVGMPPLLLSPLRWFEEQRPEFYQTEVAPLLTRYSLLA
jgi:tetratricopeptide (TPR) repeat protein/anion-transporting  ArsA/GET3 family ATPase